MPMAPRTQNAPWARFTTFVTRKTREKPRATIANTPPWRRPPITIWRMLNKDRYGRLFLQRDAGRLTDDNPGIGRRIPAGDKSIVDGKTALRNGLEVVNSAHAGKSLAVDIFLDLGRGRLGADLAQRFHDDVGRIPGQRRHVVELQIGGFERG